MTSIALAKHHDVELTEPQRRLLAGILFEILGGVTDRDQAEWKAFWRELIGAGSGEIFAVKLIVVRDGAFHRRHMKMESELFKSQDQYWSFDQFRNWLKVGAGFCDWMVVRGQFVPQPKSIGYEECDQATMEQFHNDTITFLRTQHARHHLWPHLTDAMAEDMMETFLERFDA
jgi:hypothetical protein